MFPLWRRSLIVRTSVQAIEHSANGDALQGIARPNGQATDSVNRKDPLKILPLELVIDIMKYQLEDKDPYCVLRCSWVSKLWRSTLNDQCPELWSTFAFTANEMKDKAKAEKRAAWIRRSAGRFKEVIMAGLNLTSVRAVPKSYYKLFQPVETLVITVQAPNVIPRLVDTHDIGTRFTALRHLTVKGGRNLFGRELVDNVPARQPVDCGLVGSSSRQTLETLTVHAAYYSCGSRFAAPNALPVPDTIHLFPALKQLCFSSCILDYGYRYPGRGVTIPEEQRVYQKDPLHDLLRGACNLESLEALPYTSNYSDIPTSGPRPRIFKRVEMPRLKTALIPPPRVWTIDIMARQLESLMFRMPPQSNISHRKPLIPELDDAPVPYERLAQLKVVELACNRNDDISRLRTWLERLDSVTKLVIRNAANDPRYPERDLCDEEGNPLDDNRAGIHVAQFLADHPELCPRLEELHLDCCYTNGKSVVDFVRRRKDMDGCANIQRLEMLNGTALSKKAEAALKAEVPNVKVWSQRDFEARLYQNDNFDFDMPEEPRAYGWYEEYYSL
jgi:hypothetical protein